MPALRPRIAIPGLLALLLALGGLATLPAPPAGAVATVFAVPSSNAGLGRIVTAPDGNMWFVERDTNKVGRITPAGQITEHSLPGSVSDNGDVKDLDVAPDGSLWVLYDQGSTLLHVEHPNDWPTSATGYTMPEFGEAVRVAPDGRAWAIHNFADEGIAIANPATGLYNPPNDPPCGHTLGEAPDGSMWCDKDGGIGSDAGLIHVQADGNGGFTYPLGLTDVQEVSSLAAGPVGSIWFASYYHGAWGIGTGDGEVGYVDQNTGVKTSWRTGSRTAPTSLVQGPDGNMWFTMSDGAAKGIGHISAGGVGVVSAVGAYQPTSMTFGTDGAVWFTDATNNSIVRVTTDQLQANTVDLGSGVTMSVGAPGPGGPGAGANPLVTGQVKGKRVPVRAGKLAVGVKCPKAATTACTGTALVQGKKPLTKTKTFKVKPGKTKRLKLKLTKAGKKTLAKKKAVKATVVLSSGGYTTTKKIKVVR